MSNTKEYISELYRGVQKQIKALAEYVDRDPPENVIELNQFTRTLNLKCDFLKSTTGNLNLQAQQLISNILRRDYEP